MANASDNLGSSDDHALEEYLKCPICFDLFRSPRALSCLHTFCDECLSAHIERTDTFGTIECPTCRQITSVANAGRDRSQWSKSLPLNYTILPLLEALNKTEKKSGQEDPVPTEIACVSCTSSLDVQATYCMECHGIICASCRELHKKLKVFDNHEIHSFNDDKEYRTCKKHDSKVLEFYCESHKLALCSTCAVSEHRGCDDVTEIKDDIVKETVLVKAKELNDRLASINTSTNKILDNFSQQSEAFTKNTRTVIENFNSFREAIDKRQEIQEKSMSKCQLLLAKLENTTSLLDACKQSTTKQCMFIAIQNIATRCAEFDKELKELEGLETKDWSADDVLNNFLKQTAELSTLDLNTELVHHEIERDSSSPEASSSFSLNDSQDSSSSSQDSVRLAKDVRWRFVKSSMLQRGSKGLAAWYIGMVHLVGDSIVAIDNQNHELVHLNTECEILDSLELHTTPLNLAKVNDGCVAVIFMNQKVIQLIYLADPETKFRCMYKIDEIPLDIFPLAIAHSSFGYTVVGSGTILNVDEKGTKLHEIVFDISSLNVRRSSTKNVLVNERVGMMYVSDQETNTLTVIGIGKDQISKPFYKVKKVKTPWGLDYDSDNNVYVCSDRENSVMVLSRFGDEITEIPVVRHCCKAPTTIAFGTDRVNFWVSNKDSPECMKEYMITHYTF